MINILLLLIDDDPNTHIEPQEPDIEPASDKPVDHLIFVIHVSIKKKKSFYYDY